MRYSALATDYDGTLAQDGEVDENTLSALGRLKSCGKQLVLVTGREMVSLKARFNPLTLFDIVVAENGAVLYFPQTDEERSIAPAPPAALVAALQAKGVSPLSIGHGILATWTPHEHAVLTTIRELGLDWQIIFNKGAVMCLAPGVNKASGLLKALEALQLLPENVVGIGDAENDLAFLAICGCSVAVANALVPIKQAANLIMQKERGAGVTELIDLWLANPDGWRCTRS
jgi:hydroxymethylpyrimidine pyrophosphatase-like HAD family hydrolase